MSKLSEREIVALVNACGKRVCTTEEHHGCPYGDEGCTDCVERLEADYDAAIERMLALVDSVSGDCQYCAHNKPENALTRPCSACTHFAAEVFVEGDFWELKEM